MFSCFDILVWSLLGRFNFVSKKFIDIDWNVVVGLYESFIHYISDLRIERMFKIDEGRASRLRGVSTAYKLDI